MNHLLPDVDFSRFDDVTAISCFFSSEENRVLSMFRAGTEIVSKAAKDRAAHYLEFLKHSLSGDRNLLLDQVRKLFVCLCTTVTSALFIVLSPDTLTDMRQSLAAPRLTKQANNAQLPDLLKVAHQSLVDQMKSVLANLQVRACNHPYLLSCCYFVYIVTIFCVFSGVYCD